MKDPVISLYNLNLWFKLHPILYQKLTMIRNITDYFNQHQKQITALIILLLVILAWINRFIQDDAFISFRYAEHLAQGKGLVWNEDYRVEGYTNFLWTVLMAIPFLIGIDPVWFAWGTGILLFTLTLVFTYKLCHKLLFNANQALLTTILLGTNCSFYHYATGGLETQLQTLTFVLAMYLLFSFIGDKNLNPWKALAISMVMTVSLLTRMDSIIIIGTICTVILYHILKTDKLKARSKIKFLCLVSMPLLVITGSWLLWKYSFYGGILPNTYYIKGPIERIRGFGLKYLYMFLFSYLLIPFPFIFLLAIKKILKSERRDIAIMLSMIAFWCVYIILVGGDFMEFRFLVPIMPFSFIVLVWLLFNLISQRLTRAAFILLILTGSLHHTLTYGKVTFLSQIADFSELYGQYNDKNKNWVQIGKTLGKAFDYDKNITIAVTASGMIPFYSKLRTIDMLGLNDKWVAKNGITYRDRPGHRVIAPFHYLIQQKVNLIIGHPQLKKGGELNKDFYTIEDLKIFRAPIDNPAQIPQNAKILLIPIINGYNLITMYLTPSEKIDRVIEKQGWKTIPIRLSINS